MNASRLYLLILSIVTLSCYQESKRNYKQEILEAERAFAKSAKENGVQAAFLEFAADSAALKRGGKVIVGHQAIMNEYADFPSTTTLTWEPDFIDVSSSGDLAYTYGKFQFTDIDSTGATVQRNGYFHTVWKRQADGTWKYVYD